MFGPINAQNEELHAQRTLNAFTEYEQAVEVFSPANSPDASSRAQAETIELTVDANRDNAQSNNRFFNAIKLNQQRLGDEAV